MSSRKPTAIQRLRHSLIAEWRGVADGPILDHAVLSVADMVPKIMAQYGLGERLQMEEIAAAWREVVGDFIARQTSPDSISRNVLIVRVLQPTIHHAMMMEKGTIMRKLTEKLGKKAVKDIRFKHG
jgi:hypothetical protein